MFTKEIDLDRQGSSQESRSDSGCGIRCKFRSSSHRTRDRNLILLAWIFNPSTTSARRHGKTYMGIQLGGERGHVWSRSDINFGITDDCDRRFVG